MRKGPLVIDSLDRPNAPNPNIPRNGGTDSTEKAKIAAVLMIGAICFWLLAYWLGDESAWRIIFWIPFAIIGLVTVIGSIYWLRKTFIFDGIENNTSIFGLNKNKDMIAQALQELAKAQATAYHQNVTYGDNTNNTNSTNLNNDGQPAKPNGLTFDMADIVAHMDKR